MELSSIDPRKYVKLQKSTTYFIWFEINVTEKRIQRSRQKNSPGISKKVQGHKQILQVKAQTETHNPGPTTETQSPGPEAAAQRLCLLIQLTKEKLMSK
jgi:hypothetical protein